MTWSRWVRRVWRLPQWWERRLIRAFAINISRPMMVIAAVALPLALGVSLYCLYISGNAPKWCYPDRWGKVVPSDDLEAVGASCAAVVFVTTLVLVAGAAGKTLEKDRRIRLGLCVACGYDLRASPQGRRCPECGAVPVHGSRPLTHSR